MLKFKVTFTHKEYGARKHTIIAPDITRAKMWADKQGDFWNWYPLDYSFEVEAV